MGGKNTDPTRMEKSANHGRFGLRHEQRPPAPTNRKERRAAAAFDRRKADWQRTGED